MFEAQLPQAQLLKKIIEAIRDLVSEGNLECTETGIALQAMDSSHVSLCSLKLRHDGFGHFRCDRSVTLGLNLTNLGKILKCAGNEDSVTLQAQDEGELLTIAFTSEESSRQSDFEMKLMDIECESFGIPDQEYLSKISMPSGEFQRIVRDLGVLGDTCKITVTKEGIEFSVSGDLGNGKIKLGSTEGGADKEDDQVVIEMDEPVCLTFAMRYLNLFTKATPLGGKVLLSMSPDVPILVEYPVEGLGSLQFFLAPKLDEDEEAES